MSSLVSTEQLASGVVLADRYEIERALGQGGMGIVYVARDLRLGRHVALKTLGTHGRPGSVARERLRAEAEAVASINHPGIVTLFDVLDHQGDLVLVMELVEGVSLREHLAEGPLDAREAAAIVVGVASSLLAAHRRGLVHRDVKPDNIMLRHDGRTALLDFGIAKEVGSTSSELQIAAAGPALTADGATVGTPAYLSPEQAVGEALGPASDQFSLAVVAHELLTGRSPWPMTNVAELVAAVLLKTPPAASTIATELNPAVDDVLLRAMAKEPTARFSDVEAFARAFAVALGGSLPVDAPSFSQTAGPAGRAPVRVSGASSTSAQTKTNPTPGVVRAPLELARTEVDASQSNEQPASTTASRRRGVWVTVAVALACLVALSIGLTQIFSRRTAPSGEVRSTAPSITPPSVAIADLPASPSKNQEAIERFRAAMGKASEGDSAGEMELLDAAIALDGGFASARLQRAYDVSRRAGQIDERTRIDLGVAQSKRAELPPRDQAFLQALSPAFGDPPDWVEEQSRMEALLVEYPCDPQAWDAIGNASTKRGDFLAGRRAYEQEAACDGASAMGFDVWSQLTEATEDDDRVTDRVLAECLRRQPNSPDCRVRASERLGARGNCAEQENMARKMTALAPTRARGYAARAEAVAGQHGSPDAIADLLRQKRERMLTGREEAEHLDAALLARLAGDFTKALAALVRTGKDSSQQATVAEKKLRISLLLESGDKETAGREATKWLGILAARARPERPSHDDRAFLLNVARAAGAIATKDYTERRDSIIADWKDTGDLEKKYLWMQLLGSPMNEEDARDAAPASEHLGGIPSRRIAHLSWLEPTLGSTGRFLLLAGRPEDAIPYLEDQSQICTIFPNIRSWLDLGAAFEAAGKKTEACKAYGEVLAAWGKAKPRSVTADAARARATKLGCAEK